MEPREGPSRHIGCNPTQETILRRVDWDTRRSGNIFGRSTNVIAKLSAKRALDAERILPEHRLPPEIRDSASEWTSSWKTTGAAAARTPAALWPATAVHLGGDLGSRGLSLVGAAEGLAAQLDALDSQALPDDPADGETAAGHQCTANRPAIEGEEERAQTAYLRAHQARLSVEASHPGEDR